MPKLYRYIFFVVILLTGCGKDPETPEVVHETGTVSDVDGNIYATVKIGNQWWMAENLKVTRYRNGKSIAKIVNYDTSAWKNTNTGAYCVFDDQMSAPGLLYNWYVISDTNNIAPAGWHVPGDEEWKEMERAIGMSASAADQGGWRGTDEGDKLKVQAPEDWSKYGEVWGTNQTGFTAHAGSCRLFDGRWGDPRLGFTGFWWSSTATDGTQYCPSCDQAFYRYLDYKNSNVFRSSAYKNYGFSIRCVKD